VNFLVTIKLSSDFLQDPNIYKLLENYTPIICRFCCWNRYYCNCHKGNGILLSGFKNNFFVIENCYQHCL